LALPNSFFSSSQRRFAWSISCCKRVNKALPVGPSGEHSVAFTAYASHLCSTVAVANEKRLHVNILVFTVVVQAEKNHSISALIHEVQLLTRERPSWTLFQDGSICKPPPEPHPSFLGLSSPAMLALEAFWSLPPEPPTVVDSSCFRFIFGLPSERRNRRETSPAQNKEVGM
jgi:hypothetical protein